MPKFKKISFLRILLGLITVLIGAFVVGYITELTAGDFRNWIESIVGKEKVLPTLIGLGLFSVVLLLITYLIETQSEGKESGEEKKPTRVTIEKAISDTRKGLTNSYQNRLDSKMAQRLPINLQLKYTLEGTTTKAPLYDNRTIGEKSIKEELITIFDKHRGRLLIIGEPGSGKTTLLLQLAVTLLEREERAIPIIINIATWRERFKTAEVWLEELLPQMGISKSLVQLLIKENRILPLLDGLDELAEENRKPCLEALGEFGKFNELKYVICSRKVEYAQTVDAPVYCELTVEPLTLSQIKKSLKELGTPESNGLLDAISKDGLLKEIIKVPFYLNTTQILFSSMKTLDELNFKTTNLKERKEELVQMFIDQQLNRTTYSKENSNHWLSFLAQNMNLNNQVVFELIDLQYTWSSWSKIQLFNASLLRSQIRPLSEGLTGGFILGFILCLSLAIKKTLTLGLGLGLSYGLIACFIGVLFFSLGLAITFGLFPAIYAVLFFFPDKGFARKNLLIETKDLVSWSLQKIWLDLKKRLNYIPAFGLFLGLAFVFSKSLRKVLGFFNLGGLIGVAVVSGLLLGLIHTLIAIRDKNHNSFIQLSKPYQRFTASLYSLHCSILQHWLLRHQLYRKGLLPRKLVSFLKELTKNHLFESDGATWRFRHRILQDYFAALWKEENDKTVKTENNKLQPK